MKMEGDTARECRWSLEAGKGKKRVFPEGAGRNTALLAP